MKRAKCSAHETNRDRRPVQLCVVEDDRYLIVDRDLTAAPVWVMTSGGFDERVAGVRRWDTSGRLTSCQRGRGVIGRGPSWRALRTEAIAVSIVQRRWTIDWGWIGKRREPQPLSVTAACISRRIWSMASAEVWVPFQSPRILRR